MPEDILDFDSFFKGLVTDIKTSYTANTEPITIMEFLEHEVDKKKWLIELNTQQKTVLKLFYNLELTEQERSIAEAWYDLERTSADLNKDLSENAYSALVLEVGRRGSKTTLASVIIAYEFYKLCILEIPQAKFGIAASTPIVILCLATAATQAKRTIFSQARALLRCCPFFIHLIEKKEIFLGKEEINYERKLLSIVSGNSQSSSQVGSAVILLVMDEVARFKDINGESNAEELWSNIGVSGVTFGNHAKRLAVSSAWAEGDAIQKLWLTSKREQSWVGFRLRSWDLNPEGAARDNPVIASEYSLNYDKAALEFEGIRPLGNDTRFFLEHEVNQSFNFDGCLKAEQDSLPDEELIRLTVKRIERSNVYTAMHLDPAFARDAYALAFGHSELNLDGYPEIYIDGIMAWEPKPGQLVSITNVHACVYEINNHRPLSYVSLDHHNSAETVQRFKSSGLRTEALYFSNRLQIMIYDNLRKLMHEKRLHLPRNSRWTQLLRTELISLEKINENKIDHAKDGCFVGETRIPLLDGTIPTIAELVGRKDFWVYSCTEEGVIVPGLARARKTKYVSKLLDIVLDSGAVIRCTPEHPFMLRNGKYIQAKDIVPGVTRLMPISKELKCDLKVIERVLANHGYKNWSDYINGGLGKNHKVRDIIPVYLDNPVVVYDLEVDKWDNFALAAGVFVHNSKDLADCVASVAWHLTSRMQLLTPTIINKDRKAMDDKTKANYQNLDWGNNLNSRSSVLKEIRRNRRSRSKTSGIDY